MLSANANEGQNNNGDKATTYLADVKGRVGPLLGHGVHGEGVGPGRHGDERVL